MALQALYSVWSTGVVQKTTRARSMTGRSQPCGFQPVNGGHAYVLGNNLAGESEVSEEDGECYELRARGRERTRRSTSRDRMDDIVYLVRDVQEGDTLNAIALQYFCSVADLKRANNLLNEQDFFALRSVRIPVKRFSVLTETHSSAAPPLASPGPRHCSEAPSPEAAPDSSSSSAAAESAGSFLQGVDKDIEQLVKSADSSRGGLSEVVSSLSASPRRSGEAGRKPAGRKDPYYGADWGMRWWMAVAIMLVVGIVTPVFYLLYYEVLAKAGVGHHSTTESLRATGPAPTPAQSPPHGPPTAKQGGQPEALGQKGAAALSPRG
ncbi:lysM and putative peptidoglycan-binding domain-containing protein 3 isoform X1 [Lepisosteus oculatus]|uniref:lysM and putative peptidoglycan-binding domain-containing protein 3 isoform X1 n=2 Tax=Lepisosteus oculatus TaxID=7918 RepID=UPI0037170924